MKKIIECIVCSKKVEGHFSSNRKYCSRKCFDTKRPNMVKHEMKSNICKFCKNKFVSNREKQKYCSEICYQNFRNSTNIKIECSNCLKKFSVRKSRFEKEQVKYCSIKCRNTSEDWIYSNIQKNLNQAINKTPNKLELAGRDILNEIGIEYQEQVLLCNKFLVDVFIPNKNIVIQWDGDYWHGHTSELRNGIPNKIQKKNISKDKAVTNYLNKAGYNVLRFWETDVYKNKQYVYESIKKQLSL
ncbi:COG2852 Very-short-patch-repair endonuclease [uncultured Caudovirales phage]|uniref:COG2852 Very-short-patch-repair endonuclease n=1 Tax=uncultured Caudovirales phage TaxID=2100421 RepID=A0A6J5MHP6_9CAUD|nr:COG2852 Very-short-patch-repair endonuclease [uncultured Caudovirales phage]